MNNMISQIIIKNKRDLLIRKRELPIIPLKEDLGKNSKFGFSNVFKDFGIIAEIKLVSPSAGELGKSGNIPLLASEYKEGGAGAISVVTEKYFFGGDARYIEEVKRITGLPILQKDFIFDKYQIYEAVLAKADALLLIAKIVDIKVLKELVGSCLKLGIEPVVEINDSEDLEKALKTDTGIIAVNARNLDNFGIDIEQSCRLLREVPGKYIKLAFSGINSAEEIKKYKNAGAKGVLVGTALMKSKNRKKLLKELKNAG